MLWMPILLLRLVWRTQTPDQKKTVFITGGSTGIGAASVRKFAESGWNVAFMDINVQDGQAVAQDTGALFVEGNTRNR